MNQFISKLRIYGFRKTLLFAVQELKALAYQWFRHSYSQNQEDLIIDELLDYQPTGFYVDVGANDPHRFSNTKHFYLKGWRGINIEPDPDNFRRFLKDRPADINLNIGIADKPSSLTFYKMFPDTLSTFSQAEALSYQKQGFKLVKKILVKTDTLTHILKKFISHKLIDFMSIDTEGFDYIVLKSNDWQKFKPRVICIESVERDSFTENGNNHQPNYDTFLQKVGYIKSFTNQINSIYVLQKH